MPLVDPDLSISVTGVPIDAIAALVAGEAGENGVEIEGDRGALEALREMVVIPERLREEALGPSAGRLQPRRARCRRRAS